MTFLGYIVAMALATLTVAAGLTFGVAGLLGAAVLLLLVAAVGLS